jgi:uncharacterized protein (UPF0147 family)
MDKEDLKEMEEVMNVTTKMVMKMLRKIISDKDLPKEIAKFTKRHFDALKAEGFSAKEALEIVTRMQIPSLGNLPK